MSRFPLLVPPPVVFGREDAEDDDNTFSFLGQCSEQ